MNAAYTSCTIAVLPLTIPALPATRQGGRAVQEQHGGKIYLRALSSWGTGILDISPYADARSPELLYLGLCLAVPLLTLRRLAHLAIFWQCLSNCHGCSACEHSHFQYCLGSSQAAERGNEPRFKCPRAALLLLKEFCLALQSSGRLKRGWLFASVRLIVVTTGLFRQTLLLAKSRERQEKASCQSEPRHERVASRARRTPV